MKVRGQRERERERERVCEREKMEYRLCMNFTYNYLWQTLNQYDKSGKRERCRD